MSVLLNDELIVLDKFVLVLSEPPNRQHEQTASELRLEECRNHVRKWDKVVARGRGEEERSTGQSIRSRLRLREHFFLGWRSSSSSSRSVAINNIDLGSIRLRDNVSFLGLPQNQWLKLRPPTHPHTRARTRARRRG